MPVRQMTAMRKIHSENGVAVIACSQVDGHIGLASGMRLHVDVIGVEELLGAIDRRSFDDVGKFTSSIIAFARITFGIFIGEDRTGGLEHSFGNEVLRRNQFEPLMLPAGFVLNRSENFRIRFGKSAVVIV